MHVARFSLNDDDGGDAPSSSSSSHDVEMAELVSDVFKSPVNNDDATDPSAHSRTRVPVAIIVTVIWSVFALVIVGNVFELSESEFFRVGPSSTLKIAFFNQSIDTWYKWRLLALFIAIDVTMVVYAGDMVGPWLMNVVMAPRAKLDMAPSTTWLLVNIFSAVNNLRAAVFMLIFSFTQFDFIVIQVATAAIVGACTTGWVIFQKK